MIIIIPSKQNSFCGLQDHANTIGAQLSLIGEPITISQWHLLDTSNRGTPILLEFTPLAYSRLGLSLPLLLQVVRWRLNGCRVITYFHELPFSNGRQWKRKFAATLQRGYCVLLAAASSSSVQNQETGSRWLKLLCGADRLSFLPTCSNVGESTDPPSPEIRPLQVVVFGSPGKRRHAHALVASQGGYRRLFGANVSVIDIGEPMQLPQELVSEVSALGPLPVAEIQKHLLSSRFGFFYSEPDQFSKSGVFAAYCAHGVVPIIAHSAPDQPAHYLTPADITSGSKRFVNPNAVWQSCRTWHQQFSASAGAKLIYNLAYAS
jgi:hypothetical protein